MSNRVIGISFLAILFIFAGGLVLHYELRATADQQQLPPAAVAQEQKTPPPIQPAPGQLTTPTTPAVSPDSQARIELTPLPAEFDFGEVWQDDPASREFTLKNVGTEPLTIDARSSCGCAVATKPKSPLQPGESTPFKITYNTKLLGPTSKKVTLTTNDPTRPSLEIPVKGTVKPYWSVSPNSRLVLSDLDSDALETHTFQIKNEGPRPLQLKFKEEPTSAVFDIVMKERQPGAEYEVTVKTRPPLPFGRSFINMVLETGVSPEPIRLTVVAEVPPPVAAHPEHLIVLQGVKSGMREQRIQLLYRKDQPIEIRDIKTEPDIIKCELQGPSSNVQSSKLAGYDLLATLPEFDALSQDGKVLIYTNHPSEAYQVIEIPVVKRSIRLPSGPGKKPVPIEPGRTVISPGDVQPTPAPAPGK